MNTPHAGPARGSFSPPLLWAAVAVGIVTVVRRAGWRRGGGFVLGRAGRTGFDGGPDENSPIALLGRRFAAGEIDEEEYWRRLTVLEEWFGRAAQAKGRRG